MAKITILGGGNWGTTLAILLNSNGHQVSLWEFRPEAAERLIREHENKEFLPGIPIPSEINISSDLPSLIRETEILLFVVPSHTLREVARQVARNPLPNTLIVSAVKGIEQKTLLRMSQIIKEERPDSKDRIVVLSGPNIAYEISREMPATTVVSSQNEESAKRIQSVFMNKRFRVYTNSDIIGVELGGALKNIIVIAAGICDGLGYGANTKGALLTRGLAEITRLGIAIGANPLTFAGLSGMGDLITTCFSPHSRNRYVGEQLGKGKKLDEILSSMVMVAEGINTTKAAYELAKKYSVEMPITEQVHQVLFENKEPKDAVSDLMLREPKAEIVL
ncbi:MAG: NAD(P)H-dependent glycerol-3-phosphate dehydrogenase [Candidatus Edwardsbacteria bacterium]